MTSTWMTLSAVVLNLVAGTGWMILAAGAVNESRTLAWWRLALSVVFYGVAVFLILEAATQG